MGIPPLLAALVLFAAPAEDAELRARLALSAVPGVTVEIARGEKLAPAGFCPREVEPSERRPRGQLRFEGIDASGTVYLNCEPLCRPDGGPASQPGFRLESWKGETGELVLQASEPGT